MPDYYACIALDVVDSRKINSTELENGLKTLTKELNQQFLKDMLLPFTIRNGDEVFGIFRRFADGYKVLEHLLENNRKLVVYAGCGFGQIAEPENIDVHTSNGAAILYAVEARDQYLKNMKQEAAIWNKGFSNKVFFYGQEIPFQSINSQFYMIRSYKERRSDKQREIIRAMNQHPRKTYEEIGRLFQYKNPRASISNHLKAANYELVNEMEESLIELLNLFQTLLEGKGR